MTQPPPPPPPPPPAAPLGPPGAPGPSPFGGPALPPAERIRIAYQQRHETDYVFNFWSAFGWTLLSCGVYGFYVFYQLMRRMRDHNRRRLEQLDAATTLAWERANAQGLAEDLRPNFERMSANFAVLRQMTTEFRDPAIWTVLAVVSSGIVHIVAYIFLDQDLVKHDYHEGAIEAELATVYGRLGYTVPSPDASRLKGQHNYVGRIVATVLSCGIYGLWWLYNMMDEPNRHFEHNWAWEDALAGVVQSMG